jgi:hypothetical protein
VVQARAGTDAPVAIATILDRGLGEAERDRALDGLSVEACAHPHEPRLALRVKGAGQAKPLTTRNFADPAWVSVYVLPRTAAVSARRITDDVSCGEALTRFPAPEAWVRDELGELGYPGYEVYQRHGVATLGPDDPAAADGPPRLALRDEKGESVGQVVAVREGLALDRALEHDLTRQTPHPRLRELVARGAAAQPDLEAHLLALLRPETDAPKLENNIYWTPLAAYLEAGPPSERRRAAAAGIAAACARPDPPEGCLGWRQFGAGVLARLAGDTATCDRLLAPAGTLTRDQSTRYSIIAALTGTAGCGSPAAQRKAALQYFALRDAADYVPGEWCRITGQATEAARCQDSFFTAAAVLASRCDAEVVRAMTRVAMEPEAFDPIDVYRVATRRGAALCVLNRCDRDALRAAAPRAALRGSDAGKLAELCDIDLTLLRPGDPAR